MANYTIGLEGCIIRIRDTRNNTLLGSFDLGKEEDLVAFRAWSRDNEDWD